MKGLSLQLQLQVQHSSLFRHLNKHRSNFFFNSKTSTPIFRSPSPLSLTSSAAADPFPRRVVAPPFSTEKTTQPVKDSEENNNGQGSTTARDRYLRAVTLGAVTVGVAAFMLGSTAAGDHHSRAMALGPEGPLMEEEFWDNVRRYALYALTVSTGAIYTILLPIIELLKNPISAVLLLLILGGSFYIIAQVLSAMIGVTDFSYDYGY
ncbi:hypothetical protein SAY87_007585 [Trapa incisa]|uniref:Uncharacterized protein ycf33 n=1 Tax=Trapa incisa TaxID=236973 RepID=A0AAN7KBT1_9MYRT|nr:hypothetical protein SAY87_007585 [Trapa incisa]